MFRACRRDFHNRKSKEFSNHGKRKHSAVPPLADNSAGQICEQDAGKRIRDVGRLVANRGWKVILATFKSRQASDSRSSATVRAVIEMYRVPRVAKILGTKAATVLAMIRRGELPAMLLGKRYLIPSNIFEQWVQKRVEANAAQVAASLGAQMPTKRRGRRAKPLPDLSKYEPLLSRSWKHER